jgi:transcriptional regulator with XRE-family HTH domain
LSAPEIAVTAGAKFGRRLRATRKAQKLKIAQLAEKADTGIKHLGRIERGEKVPSFDLIIALAEAMDVSPATFFEFDPPEPEPKVLRKQLDQLLANREPGQLRQAHRLLRVLFEL